MEIKKDDEEFEDYDPNLSYLRIINWYPNIESIHEISQLKSKEIKKVYSFFF